MRDAEDGVLVWRRLSRTRRKATSGCDPGLYVPLLIPLDAAPVKILTAYRITSHPYAPHPLKFSSGSSSTECVAVVRTNARCLS